MADAVACLNGKQVAAHKDGLYAVRGQADHLLVNGDNLITVKIDGSENPKRRPGGMIDYLTYAGIYRDVWLEIRSSVSIAKMKVETAMCLKRPSRHGPTSGLTILKTSHLKALSLRRLKMERVAL